MEKLLYDIVIIGGGPAGLFGAFYAGLRRMTTLIIDNLEVLGGQLVALYPDKYIYDMPGFPKVLAKTLADQLAQQALRFDPDLQLGERVTELKKIEDGLFELITTKGTYQARTVLLATGIGSFDPQKLAVPGVEEFENRGVYYFVKDREDFRGQRVVIVGGGDSAVDWALHLVGVAKSVVIVHRRAKFRAHEESVERMMASPIKMKLFHELRRIDGDDRVRTAMIFNNKTDAEEALEADSVIMALGFKSSSRDLKGWNIQLTGNKIVVTDAMETNLPGVYAAGDALSHPGSLKLIATGVGEAAIAVNNAKHRIDPSAKVFPGYSSNMKDPGPGE